MRDRDAHRESHRDAHREESRREREPRREADREDRGKAGGLQKLRNAKAADSGRREARRDRDGRPRGETGRDTHPGSCSPSGRSGREQPRRGDCSPSGRSGREQPRRQRSKHDRERNGSRNARSVKAPRNRDCAASQERAISTASPVRLTEAAASGGRDARRDRERDRDLTTRDRDPHRVSHRDAHPEEGREDRSKAGGLKKLRDSKAADSGGRESRRERDRERDRDSRSRADSVHQRGSCSPSRQQSRHGHERSLPAQARSAKASRIHERAASQESDISAVSHVRLTAARGSNGLKRRGDQASSRDGGGEHLEDRFQALISRLPEESRVAPEHIRARQTGGRRSQHKAAVKPGENAVVDGKAVQPASLVLDPTEPDPEPGAEAPATTTEGFTTTPCAGASVPADARRAAVHGEGVVAATADAAPGAEARSSRHGGRAQSSSSSESTSSYSSSSPSKARDSGVRKRSRNCSDGRGRRDRRRRSRSRGAARKQSTSLATAPEGPPPGSFSQQIPMAELPPGNFAQPLPQPELLDTGGMPAGTPPSMPGMIQPQPPQPPQPLPPGMPAGMPPGMPPSAVPPGMPPPGMPPVMPHGMPPPGMAPLMPPPGMPLPGMPPPGMPPFMPPGMPPGMPLGMPPPIFPGPPQFLPAPHPYAPPAPYPYAPPAPYPYYPYPPPAYHARARSRSRSRSRSPKRGSKGGGKREPLPVPQKFSSDLWEEPREKKGLQLLGEKAPAGSQWNYILKDENRRSFAAYLKCPFTKERCTAFFKDAKELTEWLQPEAPSGIVIPRKTAWMVAKGCQCTYRYGMIEVEYKEFPPWMLAMMAEVLPHFGFSETESWPNCCNMNLYEDGGSSVGWHSDDERLFQGKFTDIRILSLSLGVRRKFELRANWPDEGEEPTKMVVLGDGDLMTMEGMCQKHFQHRVPKESRAHGERINITWRWALKHAPQCPAGRRRR